MYIKLLYVQLQLTTIEQLDCDPVTSRLGFENSSYLIGYACMGANKQFC